MKQMKTSKGAWRPVIVTFLTALVMFGLASCQNVLNPPPEAAKGLVAVRLGSSTDASGARTIIAPETPVFSAYELTFTRSGAAAETRLNVTPAELVDGTLEVELDAGTWTVAVKAYRNIILGNLEDNYLAAEGNASFEVSSGGTNAVTVDIKPIAFTEPGAPKGIFSYAITLPTAATTATLTVGRVEPINLLTTGATAGSLELDAGTYDLRVSLENVDGLTTGLYDLVYIYSALETKAELDLQAIEFGAEVFLAGTASAGVGVSFPVTITAYSDSTQAIAIAGATATVNTDGGSWLIKVPATYIGQPVYLKAVPTTGIGGALYTVDLLPTNGKAGIILTPSSNVYVGVVAFNDETRISDISNDLSLAKTFINNETNEVDKTALCYAVSKATTLFDKSGLPAFDYRYVVTFTDGADNGSSSLYVEDGNSVTQAQVYNQAQSDLNARTGLKSYAIGFSGNEEVNATDMQKLVKEGQYRSASSVEELESIFTSIANSVLVSSKNVILATNRGLYTESEPKYLKLTVTATSDLQDGTIYTDTIIGKLVYLMGTEGAVPTFTELTPGSYTTFENPVNGTLQGQKILIPLNQLKYIQSGTEYFIESVSVEVSYNGVSYRTDTEDSSTSEDIAKQIGVVLVIDCSQSLGAAFSTVQTASESFINTLAGTTGSAPGNITGNAPSAPTGVTATATSSSSVDVSWNSVSGAASYKVYHSSSASGVYTLDGTSLSTSYTATGFSSGNTGYFKVKAVNAAGEESAYSSYASAITPISYTVTYNANGASGTVPAAQTDSAGSSVTVAAQGSLAYTGLFFVGWNTKANGTGTRYAADSSLTLNSNLTLYAQWAVNPLEGLSLNEALTWIAANAQNGNEYTIELTASESLAPKTLSYSGKVIGITLKGIGSERMILLSSNGSLFTIGTGVTLILDNNITLKGRIGNSAPVVVVQPNGFLVMNDGAKIIDNSNSSSSYYGGGVYSSGTFTMNGGTISENTAFVYGGGVYSTGTFTMSGGTISGNIASYSSSSNTCGGGVYSTGTFTMSGGTISGNTVTNSWSSSYTIGGGVYASGTFTMSGGTVSGNTSYLGGGVYVGGGTFIKSSTGGTIYGSNATPELQNTASSASYGYAVYVSSSGRRRNTTVNAGDYLNSASSEGWE